MESVDKAFALMQNLHCASSMVKGKQKNVCGLNSVPNANPHPPIQFKSFQALRGERETWRRSVNCIAFFISSIVLFLKHPHPTPHHNPHLSITVHPHIHLALGDMWPPRLSSNHIWGESTGPFLTLVTTVYIALKTTALLRCIII